MVGIFIGVFIGVFSIFFVISLSRMAKLSDGDLHKMKFKKNHRGNGN